MSLNIWIDDQIADRDEFQSFGTVHVFSGRQLNPADLVAADILIVRSITRVDRRLLVDSPVRFVGTVTTGLDHIDTSFLAARGIALATAAGFNARPVAEYVMTAVLRQIERQGGEPNERTLGIVGVGRIGSMVRDWATSLGMRVLLNDPPLEIAGVAGAWTGIDALLGDSDIVTLHVPLVEDGTHRTRDMVDAAWLDRMQRGATLINTSRGEVVNEVALKRALQRKLIGGAVIDTWCNEPRIDTELMMLCDIATPHIAGHSVESRSRGSRTIRETLAAFLQTSADDSSGHQLQSRDRKGAVMVSGDESTRSWQALAARLHSACPIGFIDREMKAAGDAIAGQFDVIRRKAGERHELAFTSESP